MKNYLRKIKLRNLPQPVFILSIHRSGSTLLQSLLDGHDELLVDVADSRYFSSLSKILKSNPLERKNIYKKDIIPYIFSMKSDYYKDFLSHISIDTLSESFDTYLKNKTGSFFDIFNAYVYALKVASNYYNSNPKYYLDKTLKSEYCKSIILKWWPNVKILCLVRDPRDIYASYKKRDIQNNRPLTKVDALVFTWRKSIETVQYLLNKLGPEQCMLIKYEELVSNKEKNISKIASFLEIHFNDSLLTPTKGHGYVDWYGNAATGKKKQGIDSNEKNKYEKYLSNKEINKIESLLEEHMKWLGYNLKTNPRSKINFPISVTKNQIRKYKYSIKEQSLVKTVLNESP